MIFADSTAAAIRALDRNQTLVIAPIAACEQHALHLPVFTDSILVAAVAERVERELADRTLLLPVFWLGASEHHLPFGGTLTAKVETLQTILVELLTPLAHEGFSRFLILNGHGGNDDPFRVALRRLDAVFPGKLWTGSSYWNLAREPLAALCDGPRKTVGHACEIETSLMLHLRPELVESSAIVDDPPTTPAQLEDLFRARDFGRSTDHGAVGYPGFASAEKGRKMLAAIVERITPIARELMDLKLDPA